MIVADTNTIAYLYLPTDQTDNVVSLLHKDPQWVAPLLWRSEFRNVLSLYVRKKIIDLDTAIAMQAQAESQLADNEYTVSTMDVLALSQRTGCSAYDCEFVSLAKSLNLKLITGDKKLIRAFPGIAMSAGDYLRDQTTGD
ncbi:MAG TPA: VapC toxin family PIN domain ribonuclease [Marinobacter hydrocarbonoclasticus]|nr:VapC toxin family PIN domain ribonuclease [Alcanivorax sp.]MBI56513.1 VapC toxin family PIN domain ribonuclease [Alcanivorax sp.]MBM1145129.1 type II toxin-antitoxin system VapC family toxin [Alcanivorax sp. ZXX171]UWN49620.1 tRNA(fMet)-specific endonuclease VapC [Alcanivorax sp. ALC70]HAX10882.1 VapC toxin family PIN domain ribonuclease [Marinobacter nauticus]